MNRREFVGRALGCCAAVPFTGMEFSQESEQPVDIQRGEYSVYLYGNEQWNFAASAIPSTTDNISVSTPAGFFPLLTIRCYADREEVFWPGGSIPWDVVSGEAGSWQRFVDQSKTVEDRLRRIGDTVEIDWFRVSIMNYPRLREVQVDRWRA